MSRVTGYNEKARTVTWTCSACGKSHTTAASAARNAGLAGGPPVVAMECPNPECDAVVFVPYNDWNDPDLLPDLHAELANQLFYLRGATAPHPEVRLLATDDEERHGLAGARVDRIQNDRTPEHALRVPPAPGEELGAPVGAGELATLSPEALATLRSIAQTRAAGKA